MISTFFTLFFILAIILVLSIPIVVASEYMKDWE